MFFVAGVLAVLAGLFYAAGGHLKKRPRRLRGNRRDRQGKVPVSDRHGIIIREYCHLFPIDLFS